MTIDRVCLTDVGAFTDHRIHIYPEFEQYDVELREKEVPEGRPWGVCVAMR